MNFRNFAVRAISFGAITAAAIGLAGPAAAAPAPAAYFTVNGPTMPTLGQSGFCNGLIDTVIETDPTRPGLARVGLTSRGMRGVGPDWQKNPKCKVNVTIGWNLSVWANQIREVELELGEAPGETVWTEINPGSGVASINIQAGYANAWFTKLYPQTSMPVISYVLIP